MNFQPFLDKVSQGGILTRSEARQAFDGIMDGIVPEIQIAAFLAAMTVRGERVNELVGAVEALRSRCVKVNAPADAIDCCGTGGDQLHTFNISTTVALVLAGGGVPVAKHGNRSASSKCGGADVLEALGVRIDGGADVAERCLEKANLCFLLAPAFHPAMKAVVPVRKTMATRTIFNQIGPLANPAGVTRQLIGVPTATWVKHLAQALETLGCQVAWLVNGHGGMDELSTIGPNKVTEVCVPCGSKIETINPTDFGLATARLEDLRGGDETTNADIVTQILKGETGPRRDIVILNAAAGFVITERCEDIASGLALARESLDSGKAKQALEKLIEASQ
ncbi:MAG: anthranilate phosphoribosyltransferase [Pseudomonadota bacterium]